MTIDAFALRRRLAWGVIRKALVTSEGLRRYIPIRHLVANDGHTLFSMLATLTLVTRRNGEYSRRRDFKPIRAGAGEGRGPIGRCATMLVSNEHRQVVMKQSS
jgi:hypothetical protein